MTKAEIHLENARHLFRSTGPFLSHISGKSKLAEAICYAIARREFFDRFLSDGLIVLEFNFVERAIRPQTIPRKYSPSPDGTAAATHGPTRHTFADLKYEHQTTQGG
ncbi:transposase [Paracoccus aestuariivivens]|uniref:Transposase n=1 Tax=Paracoccus aestuariivivens TaxID=1820333 RepID=A0A6L6JDU1_9RHOB|nr:transposase [Paracoccus aestuariivivens]MTH80323.1 transposase [Paracoccus aestuariivivens]